MKANSLRKIICKNCYLFYNGECKYKRKDNCVPQQKTITEIEKHYVPKDKYDRLKEQVDHLSQYAKCSMDYGDGIAHGGASVCQTCYNNKLMPKSVRLDVGEMMDIIRNILTDILIQVYYNEMYPLSENPTTEECTDREQKAIDEYLGKTDSLKLPILHAKVRKTTAFTCDKMRKKLSDHASELVTWEEE